MNQHQQQPYQEHDSPSRLPNIILRQKLPPLPLLKQSIVSKSASELELLNPKDILRSTARDIQKDDNNYKTQRKFGKFTLEPINKLYQNQFHSVRNYGRLCDQPFLEFTTFHQKQLIGGKSYTQSTKKLPDPKSIESSSSPPSKFNQKNIIIIHETLISNPTKIDDPIIEHNNKRGDKLNIKPINTLGDKLTISNDNQPLPSPMLPSPMLQDIKSKTFIKKVLKLPAFGVILHFYSMHVNLEIMDQEGVKVKKEDKQEKGRKRKNKGKHTIKLDIQTLEILLKHRIQKMVSLIKKCIIKGDNGEFELDLSLLLLEEQETHQHQSQEQQHQQQQAENHNQYQEAEKLSTKDEIKSMENEFPAESHREIINIDYNNYMIWIKFAELELYIPELNHNERMVLTRRQLMDLIKNEFKNLTDYTTLFEFIQNCNEDINELREKSLKKKYLLILGENIPLTKQMYDRAEKIIYDNKQIVFKINTQDFVAKLHGHNYQDVNHNNNNNNEGRDENSAPVRTNNENNDNNHLTPNNNLVPNINISNADKDNIITITTTTTDPDIQHHEQGQQQQNQDQYNTMDPNQETINTGGGIRRRSISISTSKFGVKEVLPDDIKNDLKRFNMVDYIVVFVHLNNEYSMENTMKLFNMLGNIKLDNKGNTIKGKKLMLIATISKSHQELKLDNMPYNERLLKYRLYNALYKQMIEQCKMSILEHFIVYMENNDDGIDHVHQQYSSISPLDDNAIGSLYDNNNKEESNHDKSEGMRRGSRMNYGVYKGGMRNVEDIPNNNNNIKEDSGNNTYKILENMKTMLLDIDDLQILDFQNINEIMIIEEKQKEEEEENYSDEENDEIKKKEKRRLLLEKYNISIRESPSSTIPTLETLSKSQLIFTHFEDNMPISIIYNNLTIKLEKEINPEEYKLQSVYQMNLIEFYEVILMSENFEDVNIYIVDKFDIQKNLMDSQDQNAMYMLQYKKLHEDNTVLDDILPYEITQKNIDHGFLQDMNLIKTYDDNVFRISIMYPYIVLEEQISKAQRIVKADQDMMNQIVRNKFNFNVVIQH